MPTKEELVKMYEEEGKNFLEIAQIYDVRKCNVHYWIKKYGIKKRNSSEARDLRGKRFGNLIAKKYIWGKRGATKWECQCDCGESCIILRKSLTGGKRSHCGCKGDYRKKRNEESPNWKGICGISGSFFRKHINHAKLRGIKNTVSKEYLVDCLERQNRKCALTGDELWFKDMKTNASIDRIDSSKGYEEGNIQWVTICANFAKQRMSNKEFLELCQKVVNNQKKESY